MYWFLIFTHHRPVSMPVPLKATNIELTPAIQEYVEERVAALQKYYPHIISVRAEVELTTRHHHKGDIFRAELNVRVPGQLLRVEKTTSNLYKAIDKAKDHMAEELRRFKGKAETKTRKVARRSTPKR